MSKSAHPQPYGFVKLYRSPETKELMSDPFAFVLLSQIAYRARWRVGPNRYGLRIGEALIGDVRSVGLTQQQYREAKKRLTRWGFATFRATNRGTIARLTSSVVFDLNLPVKQRAEQRPAQRANNEPTTSQQRLTKNEIRKERMNDDDKRSIESSGDYWPQHYSEESEAKKDPRWKSFAEFCRRKGGTPMLKGFNTWLQKQPSLKRKQIQHSSNGSASYQDALIASMHRGDIENEVPIALRRPL